MSLREDLLDAMIDGKLGNGLVIKRADFVKYFGGTGSTYAPKTVDVFLSNSELDADHSPTYAKFTVRMAEGKYRVHPEALASRMRERSLI